MLRCGTRPATGANSRWPRPMQPLRSSASRRTARPQARSKRLPARRRTRPTETKRPPAGRTAARKGKARDGTKQALLIAMLKRPEGATLAQIVEATGWQPHTVRGALAGALKKRLGLVVTSEKVEGRERVYSISLPTASGTPSYDRDPLPANSVLAGALLRRGRARCAPCAASVPPSPIPGHLNSVAQTPRRLAAPRSPVRRTDANTADRQRRGRPQPLWR